MEKLWRLKKKKNNSEEEKKKKEKRKSQEVHYTGGNVCFATTDDDEKRYKSSFNEQDKRFTHLCATVTGREMSKQTTEPSPGSSRVRET